MSRRQEHVRDELDQRIRDLEAERCRPVPGDYHPSRWSTAKERRQALAEAIGTTDTYEES
jgi:hypothetical protein